MADLMYSRTRVKICGITNLEDARTAIAAGADALGFVFYQPSPRYIEIARAKQIINALAPLVNCVGLFVDAGQAYIKQVIKQVSIDTLQFHGQESESACALYDKPYIKAIRMTERVDLKQEAARYHSAKALLLDTFVEGTPGGTGRSFDWHKIPADMEKPIVLAGGLDVSNVRAAIHQTRPFAVDVSGGVESSKGKKDPEKIINFMRETLNA